MFKITDITKIKDNKNIFYKIKNSLIKNSFKLEKSYPYINGLIFGKDDYIKNDVHIPQELRIRSRGTERHSASN